MQRAPALGLALLVFVGLGSVAPLVGAEGVISLPTVTVTERKEPTGGVTIYVGDALGPTGPQGGTGAAGGGVVPNPGNPVDPAKNPKDDRQCKAGQAGTTAGNPVNFATGNKIESEQDFATAGEFPLEFTRTYNALWDGYGIFGANWLTSFDYKLLMTTNYSYSACYPKVGGNTICDPAGQSIWAQRPDGRTIKFNWVVGSSPQTWNEDKALPIARVVRNPDGTFTHYSEDNTVETYDAGGYPLSIKNEHGVGWTFNWSASHYLNSVVHASGRTATIGWNGTVVTSIADPAGNVYSYSFNPNVMGVGRHLLTQTSQPGVANPASTGGTPAVTRTYTYGITNFPSRLTGVTLNGGQFSWFGYDSQGRASSTRHSGTNDQFTFSYGTDAGGIITSANVTNPLGRTTTYTFAGGKVVTATGLQTTNCPSTFSQTTYDANGYPQRAIDPRGVATDYVYNARGQLAQRADDATGNPRVTTFAWDASNHQTQEVIAGYRQVDTIYRPGDARVSSQTVTNLTTVGGVGRALTTSFGYTMGGNGLLAQLTSSGPNPSSISTWNYDGSGNATSFVNALGHMTTFSAYNGLGLPGTVTDPNGAITNYTYDPRGRVATIARVVNGANWTTKFAYSAKGQVTDTWLPDGRRLSRSYDASYRLTSEYEVEYSSPNAEFPTKTDSITRYTNYTYNALN